MPSFSTTLEQSIHAALALANSRSHEFATLEHLLLALIDEPDAARVMKACSVDTEELRTTLVEFIDDRAQDNALCTIHRVTGSGGRVSMQCDLDVLSGRFMCAV